jgi:hypothetical protein
MSLNQLTLDQKKPWLNVRVNNLTVDGTYIGPGSGGSEFVVKRGTTPNPALTPNPDEIIATITATLTPSMIPVPNSWYSMQYLVCLALPGPFTPGVIPFLRVTKCKVSDFNILAYVDADFKIVCISSNEWNSEYPSPPGGGLRYQADVNGVNSLAVGAINPYEVTVEIKNLGVGLPLDPNPAGYNYSFEVSDVKRLTSN